MLFRSPTPVVSDTETDFNDEQYPPAEDRYKQLEDRLNAMEIQRVPGLDFGDLGLSTGVVIPSLTQQTRTFGSTSSRRVFQGLTSNGSISWMELAFVTGRTWPLLFTSSINIIPTSLLRVPNSRVPKGNLKVLKSICLNFLSCSLP